MAPSLGVLYPGVWAPVWLLAQLNIKGSSPGLAAMTFSNPVLFQLVTVSGLPSLHQLVLTSGVPGFYLTMD